MKLIMRINTRRLESANFMIFQNQNLISERLNKHNVKKIRNNISAHHRNK